MNEVEFMNIYAAIVKDNKSPMVNIDTHVGQVVVPRDLIEEDGSILLDISPSAVRYLKVENETVYCRASFNKEVFCLSFPLDSIIEMYAGDAI